MKRITLLVLLTVGALTARAEVTHSIGVQAGFARQLHMLNNPKISEADKTKLEKTPLNGVKIGLAYETMFVKGFGLYTALNYNFTVHSSPWETTQMMPNGRPTSMYKQYDYRYKAEAHTVDLNLELEYKFEIAGNTYLVLYTGPSVEWIGKYAAEDIWRDNSTQEEKPSFVRVLGYDAADMAEYYRRWNVTWGLGAAFQYGRYFLRGGYNFGLVNPYKYSTFSEMGYEGDKRLTRGRLDNWSIKLGVFLWNSDK